MNKILLWLLCCLLPAPWLAPAADAPEPRYFETPPGTLAVVKARLAAHDPALEPALQALVQAADKALPATPPSVMDKAKLPPSGDRHDYMSVAPYFWPDPAKPDGLPYIRHDGKVNPESREAVWDHGRLEKMGSTVDTLALAYYFTGQEAYATAAARWLRVWFLDPATRMNPHLNYAQAIPGVNPGRGTGILEGRHLATAANAAQLLVGSPAWPAADQAALHAWLTTYLHWLLTSPNGLDEARAKNNHGSFYDVQAMEIALVLDQTNVARQIAGDAKTRRIDVQIEADGRQPLELARTAAFGYSVFNLEALFTLATLAEYTGVDVWPARVSDGPPALRVALDFLAPYAVDAQKPWPYQQIRDYRREQFAPLLRRAANVWQEPRYEAMLAQMPGTAAQRFQLLQPARRPVVSVADHERARVLRAAAVALNQPPLTITAFRAAQSAGGSNDFYSNADYYWPDPAKPDGLPYIQRDGQSNPGNFNQHRLVMRQLRDAVAALGAAYRLSHEDRYAAKAAALLQIFFLDPATRMNPSLPYAQAVPGVTPGRSYGIIDTLHLIDIPPAITALGGSPAFPPATLAGLKTWFHDYTEWMLSSHNGQLEAAAKNNHAVACWLQIAVFAKFTGDEPRLAECRRQFQEVLVPNQMAPDGSFPLELKRTKPYGYSIFQLENLCALAQVLSTPEHNLWTFELPDGRGLRRAVAYLYPFLADKTRWPLKPDVQAWDGWPARPNGLLFASRGLHEPQYFDLWARLTPDPTDDEVKRNLAITQPLLWVTEGL